MKIITGIRKSSSKGTKPDQFQMVRKGSNNQNIIKSKILTLLTREPMGNYEGTDYPIWDFYIIDDRDNKTKVMNSIELSGEVVGIVDEETLIQFEMGDDGNIKILRIEDVNESLPRESTVKQLKRIKKQIDKEIGGDIGDRISDMSKQGANIQFIRNPIESGIESYEDYLKDARKIYKFDDFKKVKMIKEEFGYEFGCVKIDLQINNWKDITNMIQKEDLFIDPNGPSFGIQKDPHITILYPVNNGVDPILVEKVIKGSIKGKMEIEVDGLGLFENEKFDVIKLNVKESPILMKLHQDLKSSIPNGFEWDKYKPHITIAFLKSGMGKKYLGEKIKLDIGDIKKIIYQESNGKEHNILI